MSDHDNDARRVSFGRRIELGNIISPLLTVLALGIPALLWAGKIDTRVDELKTGVSTVRIELDAIKASANTMSVTLVGMNFTISEGLKQGLTELQRRVVNLESRVDRQADEINKLQIELATIRRASEPSSRAR